MKNLDLRGGVVKIVQVCCFSSSSETISTYALLDGFIKQKLSLYELLNNYLKYAVGTGCYVKLLATYTDGKWPCGDPKPCEIIKIMSRIHLSNFEDEYHVETFSGLTKTVPEACLRSMDCILMKNVARVVDNEKIVIEKPNAKDVQDINMFDTIVHYIGDILDSFGHVNQYRDAL